MLAVTLTLVYGVGLAVGLAFGGAEDRLLAVGVLLVLAVRLVVRHRLRAASAGTPIENRSS